LRDPLTITWIALFAAVLIWSGINPKDTFTWVLEIAPALIAAVVLAATIRRFAFTLLTYTLILIHNVILMVGGHYTYAEVPFFEDSIGNSFGDPIGNSFGDPIGNSFSDPIGDLFGFFFDMERNNYDKLGHLAQGFIPAMVAREILVRANIVNGKWWLVLFVFSFCLGFSAFYELIEWWVALLSGEDAEAFLGTKGYEWDTQPDMGFALLGASSSLLFLSHWQDRQITKLKNGAPP
jgi:putative membrane protein